MTKRAQLRSKKKKINPYIPPRFSSGFMKKNPFSKKQHPDSEDVVLPPGLTAEQERVTTQKTLYPC